jgi:hypothetical protein
MLIEIRSRSLMKYGFHFADFHETDRYFANFYEHVLPNFNIINILFVKQLHIYQSNEMHLKPICMLFFVTHFFLSVWAHLSHHQKGPSTRENVHE